MNDLLRLALVSRAMTSSCIQVRNGRPIWYILELRLHASVVARLYKHTGSWVGVFPGVIHDYKNLKLGMGGYDVRAALSISTARQLAKDRLVSILGAVSVHLDLRGQQVLGCHRISHAAANLSSTFDEGP